MYSFSREALRLVAWSARIVRASGALLGHTVLVTGASAGLGRGIDEVVKAIDELADANVAAYELVRGRSS